MDIGEYEFGTNTIERMTVISENLLYAYLKKENWQKFCKGETFTVAAHQKFHLKVEEPSAYLCQYE